MGFFPYVGVSSWFFCAIPFLFVIGMVFCFLRCRSGKWSLPCCSQTNEKELAILRRELDELKQKLK